MKRTIASLIAAGLLASGCATVVGPSGDAIPTGAMAPPAAGTLGSELFEAKVRAVSVDPATATAGAVNTIHFRTDGVAHSFIEPMGPTVTGRWWIRDSNSLCFTWPVRGQDCWPYVKAIVPGQTMTVTSDRGQTAQITLLAQ